MSRVKKSRKSGQLAVRKTDAPRPEKAKRLFEKKRKGLQAGARYIDDNANAFNESLSSEEQKDPRIGSKKPIDLHAKVQAEPAVTERKAAPNAKPKAKLINIINDDEIRAKWQTELDKIEADQELQDLLDRYDDDETLTPQELAKVNKMTARYTDLMDKLGIAETDDLDEDEALLNEWNNTEGKGDW
ncbi:Der GTPase-activating protein YihI [Algibacillus agarilyticus]|uniref:Der GTPase-activating protein YihI n=1 Tax=Algibacillus agarilyticus TaxID=2234133 RepID=UPI000DCFF3A5|nr:Der GTPase-activating protein YihI [Algibacillus agarilyticus]